MDVSEESAPANGCGWCPNIGKNRCGRCRRMLYCCREHQVQHWPEHKKECRPPAPDSVVPKPNIGPKVENSPRVGNVVAENTINVCVPSSTNRDSNKTLDYSSPSEEELFSSLGSELLSSANNFWDVINNCDPESMTFDYGTYLEKEKINETVEETPSTSSENRVPPQLDSPGMMQTASLSDICTNIVHDLNKFGICVLDKFLGPKYGDYVVQEVKSLYERGIFKKGELVNVNPYIRTEGVRSDVTTWVDGSEPDCRNIGNLIQKLDCLVTACNKMPKNGILSKYKLHRRTKAMIACYPADGTHYKKHIDNPNGDGRCITCIYYLNKDWDVKADGGTLRMFPVAHSTQIANIEPIFDRMIFFWSDKRNPHEVLPSYKTRFAITVWYFDADERDCALSKSRTNVKK